MIYFARKHDRVGCALKPQCCPNAPARKIARPPFMRLLATRPVRLHRPRPTPCHCRQRKKGEKLFAHLKRILRLERLRIRGPSGAKDELPVGRHRPKSGEIGEAHRLPAANLRQIRRRGPESLRPDCRRPTAIVRSHQPGDSSTQFAQSGRLEST